MVEYVKYCPLCGAGNPKYVAFCRECLDGDLSTVPAELPRDMLAPIGEHDQPVDASSPATAEVAGITCCTLELVDDPHISFRVRDGQTIGRTARADVALNGVPKADWISGVHALLFHRDEQWYVQHMGQTNFIKVDGEQYNGREEVALYDGSILVLSLTAFRVRFGDG